MAERENPEGSISSSKLDRDLAEILQRKGVELVKPEYPKNLTAVKNPRKRFWRQVFRYDSIIIAAGLLIAGNGLSTCSAGVLENSRFTIEAETRAEAQVSAIYPIKAVDQVLNPAEYSSILRLRQERKSFKTELKQQYYDELRQNGTDDRIVGAYAFIIGLSIAGIGFILRRSSPKTA